MKALHSMIAAALIAASAAAGPAAATDSVERGSAASLGASLMVGRSVAWAAHAGSELTVKAMTVSGDSVTFVLQGASGAIEVSAQVAKELADAASVAVGTSLKVVAESTGTALIASGVLLAYFPNEVGRALLHHAPRREKL